MSLPFKSKPSLDKVISHYSFGPGKKKIDETEEDILLYIKKFLPEDSGLLSCTQPLISTIASLSEIIDPTKTFAKVSHQYIHALVQCAPIASVFLDLNLKILCISPSWTSWFSYIFDIPKQESQKIIKEEAFLKPVLEKINAPEILLQALENALQGKSTYDELVEFWSPQGERRAFRFECFPWYDKTGKISNVMMFAEDKTQCRQIRDAYKKLGEANEMLENFSLIFSHDLIQPLRQISNFMNILQVHLEKSSKSDVFAEMSFQKIFKVIEGAEKLCREIVFYCRHGDFAVNPQPTNFDEVLSKIIKTCIETTKVSFINKLPPELMLYINPTCLFQLLQNLVANAVKYSAPSNPLITLSGKEAQGGFFSFDLHNTGYCYDENVTQNPFDAFVSTHKDGAGLGLMICKKIVSAYKGEISMRFSPKEGTTVSFTLPLYEKEEILAN